MPRSLPTIILRGSIGFALCLVCCFAESSIRANDLQVGSASVSITPDKPIALSGQMHTRISQGVESPVMAVALALESRADGKTVDQAIMVACDLVAIPTEVMAKTRARLKKRLPDFPSEKLSLGATHTHTSPVLLEGLYDIPNGVMQPTEYVDFFAEQVAEAAAKAWETRQPGKVGWGLGHAVIGQNRRAVYADGTAVMYGSTSAANFRQIEGPEDHGVEVLCFWDAQDKLVATAINIACPSQEVEGGMSVNADFWHQVRTALQDKYGKGLNVICWCGTAGDQSPHLMLRQKAEERMQKLRKLNRLNEIAGRILRGWEEAYEGAKQEMHADAPLVHHVQEIELPRRVVTEREWKTAKATVEELTRDKGSKTLIWWHGEVVKRYERQKAGTVEPYKMELHVLRLGDVAITTNDFELFTDYGIEIKARSPALQAFNIQLSGPGSYLPTARAVAGGGYSAIAESNEISPEGGQVLVERTVEQLKSLWPAAKK